MSRIASVVLVCCAALVLLAPAAARAEWSVGSDIGLSYFSPEDGDGITNIGWGGNATILLPAWQPGLRFGVTLGSPASEIVFTSSLMILSTEGESFRSLQGMAAYQHNFNTEERSRFFMNAGLGLNLVGDDDDSYTAPVFGVGLGTRQMMGHGHGAIRIEARLDHQNEFEDGGFTVFPAANVFAMRIGWELWN